MTENWDFYLCRVNNALSSIYVDLGYHDVGRDEARPWLHWSQVAMKSPRPDGLSDASETATLGAIEDALKAALQREDRLRFVGRITTQGRREFYFYGTHSESISGDVERVLQSFEGYQAETGSEFDAEWLQYFEVLYPSPAELQRINNRHVLEALKRNGDVHSRPRPVRHWIYFADADARAKFAASVSRLGYAVELGEGREHDERPFGVCVERTSPVDQATMDAAVEQLNSLLDDGAEYDGWETQVATDPPQPWWRRLLTRVT